MLQAQIQLQLLTSTAFTFIHVGSVPNTRVLPTRVHYMLLNSKRRRSALRIQNAAVWTPHPRHRVTANRLPRVRRLPPLH